jgi:hypothetical protein
MPPSMSMRAVVIGLGTLVSVYATATLLLNLLVGRPDDDPGTWILLAPMLAVALWLLPGFMTGYIAKHAPLKHGLALGTGSLVLTLVILGVVELMIEFTDSLPMAMVVGFLIPIFVGSCIGTFIGNYVATRHNTP